MTAAVSDEEILQQIKELKEALEEEKTRIGAKNGQKYLQQN